MIDRYDHRFFDYIAQGSMESARIVVPLIRQWLPVHSVLDVGCGRGAWLKIWRECGVEQVIGLDGDYVDTATLLIPPENFRAANVDRPFALDRRFDLVTCLEVAEHLSPDIAGSLVRCLGDHADYVLFSAAVPGQGGANHINEQPYGYWKKQFESVGFTMLDCIRPAILNDARVKRWYRYNLFLFVREACCAALPEQIRSTTLERDQPPPDVSPLWYKLRKALIRRLPPKTINFLAAINERWTRL